MSYNQPPNQYGGPPPQQGGWGQPPPNQQQWGGHQQPPGPPPNWNQGQNQYGPPQGHQQWNAPPGPPPGQQQWNAPPGPPHNQQYGAPQGPPPNQQQWGAPQAPPPQQNFGPPQGAPPQNFGQGAPAQPSFGYVFGQLAQGWNATNDANALRAAMKGFGTNEKELIRVLAPLDPLQVNSVRTTFNQLHRRDLEKDIASETSSYFKETLLALVRGPLIEDAHAVKFAVVGAGTNEALLNHIVLGRSNADLRAIKETYNRLFKRRMEDDIDGDLSMKTKDLFRIVLRAQRNEENTQVTPDQVNRDVAELQRALSSSGAQVDICNVIALRSDGQLRAISHAFQQTGKSLHQRLESKFDGHMKDALLLMLDRAADPIMSDAVQLEAAMAGMGTKDRLLVHRVVSCHWNRQHKDQVKRAYQQRFRKDLVERIRGETSGDYQRMLVALMQ